MFSRSNLLLTSRGIGDIQVTIDFGLYNYYIVLFSSKRAQFFSLEFDL